MSINLKIKCELYLTNNTVQICKGQLNNFHPKPFNLSQLSSMISVMQAHVLNKYHLKTQLFLSSSIGYVFKLFYLFDVSKVTHNHNLANQGPRISIIGRTLSLPWKTAMYKDIFSRHLRKGSLFSGILVWSHSILLIANSFYSQWLTQTRIK